ncbi:MAG: alpha/beta hydrolase-fold protein, partial [Capnocytophaga sp.]|nr:alpha/beta hydrolase-fold protein [Capnocytophaga sp.]
TMKKISIILCCLFWGGLFAQTTIRVSVPNETDEVYIVGNQKVLGDWKPNQIKMDKISMYERQITLNLSFPVAFKFTRGSWESEAIVNHRITEQSNLVLETKPEITQHYKIQGWSDQISEFSTYSHIDVIEINSLVFNTKRRLYVALPEGYDTSVKYPVIYVTDAQNTNNFEIVTQTLRQQANFYNYPKCIVVGIYSKPELRNADLDINYGESGRNFKDYIFNEVIPFVNKTYSTSDFKAIYGHSNGAEYNHYLMFEKDNPFDVFINISEHLIDLHKGQPEAITAKFIDFIKTNQKPIKYFVASGIYDDYNRYPSGLEIEKIFTNTTNERITFQHKVYKSWHNDLIGRSIVDAFDFIFAGYQDYSIFEKSVGSSDFNYQKTKELFVKQNEVYISPYSENDAVSNILEGIIIQGKSRDDLTQYFEYEDPDFDGFHRCARAIVYFENGFIDDAVRSLKDAVKENTQRDVKNIVFAKADFFTEIYKSANQLDLAFKNLEIILKKNPKFDKELRYLLAKVGLENKIQVAKSKKYLQQAQQKYTENSIYTLNDIEELKK